MSNFNITVAAVAAVKPAWLALADNGAILPGVAGRFIIGNPTGQLNTVAAKAFPKGAETWEPTATGAIIRTSNGKASLADMPGAAPLMAADTQSSINSRVNDATGAYSATIDGRELATILTAIAPVAAGAEKVVISNILLRINPGASVAVATDGYCLVERVIPDVNGATFDALIDARDAKAFAALLKADGFPLCRLACNDGRLTIIAGNVAYFGPDSVYGTFPTYERIIPSTSESLRIVVNVKELLAAIKAATLKGATTKVDAANGYGIRFASVSGDNEASATCSADVSEDWSVYLDLAILTVTLKGLDCESVVIYPNAVSKLGPIVIRPLTGACRAIVMPVNHR